MNARVTLRIPVSVKEKAARAARRNKESLNEWIGKWVRTGIEIDAGLTFDARDFAKKYEASLIMHSKLRPEPEHHAE